MEQYPLLFTFRDVIHGNGYTAGVEIAGRALMVSGEDEDPAWWVYGVEPGGFAESGADSVRAYNAFRDAYRLVVFDIAHEAIDFDAFDAGVRGFFANVSDAHARDWSAAVGQFDPKEGALAELERQPAESPRGVVVVPLDPTGDTSDRNQLDRSFALAEAA